MMQRHTPDCLNPSPAGHGASARLSSAPQRIYRPAKTRSVSRTTISVPTSIGGLLCYFAVVCLFFTQTNYVPVSALLFVLLPVYPFLSQKFQGSFDLAMLSLTACFLFSAVVLDPKSIVDYEFFRRDGNVFVSWAPLLLLSRVQYRIDVARILRWFVVVSAVMCSGLIVAWKLGQLRPGSSEFFHLFYAHNAAGGFLAIACGFSLALVHRQNRMWLWAFAPLLAGLVLTNSRGSILGFGLAVAMVYLVPKRLTWLVVLVAALSSVAVLHHGYSKSKGIVDYSDAETWNTSAELGLGRQHTILGRVYGLWPRGIRTWAKSPIVGTGFGSFNDAPHHYSGWNGVLMWSQGPKIHSDGHAHHSYVHVLAETGVVGLALLVWFLSCIYKKILDAAGSPTVRAGLLLGFWTLVFASFTEHRIVTPSNVLPFTLMLGLMLANANALGGSKVAGGQQNPGELHAVSG
tara:strand:+ start:98918 stop:100297 length:1380 start_codon:yes stop_codon:yes gene_type:complete